MKSIKISPHSFIDIITNSSSEIYVQASENTVKVVKTLVDSILKMSDSYLTCDDLFDIRLELPSDQGEDEEYDENPDQFYSDYGNRGIIVTAKNQAEHSVQAANILSNLTGIFSIEEGYN